MNKIPCNIEGVSIFELDSHKDGRGWLIELFRSDEIPDGFIPEMSYVSLTYAGQTRGPHEHKKQTDYFCMIGPAEFEIYMWDNRAESPSFKEKFNIKSGRDRKTAIIIPPGVVHGYKNIDRIDGYIINFPNRLFAGKDRREPIDEIRYENSPESGYIID